jgi:hypothetical protein
VVIGAKHSKLHIAKSVFHKFTYFSQLILGKSIGIKIILYTNLHEFAEKVYHLVYRGLCIDTRQRLKYRYVSIHWYSPNITVHSNST